ncbi:MAG: MBL fold metallo-hydrolase [Clostridia bacterium]|nr:MBL fold metallo-hydrolase [Clostridia bacterium]
MIKKHLEENLILYTFDPDSEGRLGTNIVALIHEDDALLIDCGYEQHMKEVMSDLKQTVKKVIPSHFHPDHVLGILELPGVEIYGNQHALEPLERYEPEHVSQLKPTNIIEDGDELAFGKFHLRFEHLPGHSNCTMAIHINETYCHIGDLYMTMNDGTDTLPYVEWSGVKTHIQSLESLSKNRVYLLSHGKCPIAGEVFMEGLQNRIGYLKKVLDSENSCTTETATSHFTKPFKFLHWREFVK